MSRVGRAVIVVAALALLAAALFRAAPICFSVVWFFLWWAGGVRDNAPTPGLEWIVYGLDAVAVVVLGFATIIGARWVLKGSTD